MGLTKASYAMITKAPINIVDLGADPTGTTNSAPAIQAAIESIRTTGGAIYIPSGAYKVTSAINLTNINTVQITIFGDGRRNTRFNVSGVGNAFDCTGSQFLKFCDFAVWGSANTAFLFARNSTGNSAGGISMWNMECNGTWAIAAMYNYAAEEFRAYDCSFINDNPNVSVVVITRNNIKSVSSIYATIATGSQSTTEYAFYGCSINHYAATGSAPNLYLETCASVCFYKLFMSCEANTNDFIYFDQTNGASINITFDGVMFDGTNTARKLFHVGSGAQALAYININNVLNYNGGSYGFYAETNTNISYLTIKNFENIIATSFYSIENSNIEINGIFNSDYNGPNNYLLTNFATATFARPDFWLSSFILYIDTGKAETNHAITLKLVDGVTTPTTAVGYAFIYVDSSDGDLKVKFGDGTVKTIVVDT